MLFKPLLMALGALATTLSLAQNAPTVRLRGTIEKALLVPGARVMVTAQEKDAKPTALRVLVGRNGFAPPM